MTEQNGRTPERNSEALLSSPETRTPPELGAESIPDLAVEVARTSASEPLSPERERELARAAVVAALVALRLVQASASQQSTPPRRRFAAPVRSHRRTVRGSWRHRL